MIDASERGSWREIEAKLRSFIVRRVDANVDVDDIVQDVFLRMQQGLGKLRDDERFGPWMYQIARNAIFDHQRVAAKHRVVEGHTVRDNPELVAEDCRAMEDLASHIVEFVAMLRSPYREALTLTDIEGLTQKQAAEMLGISLSGMKSRVQRGRSQISKALADCCTIDLDARCRVVSCEPRPDGLRPEGCCIT